MKLDNMFKKTRIVSRIQSHSAVRASRPEVPEGLLRKCNKCGAAIIAEDDKTGILYLSEMRRIFPCTCISQNPDGDR